MSYRRERQGTWLYDQSAEQNVFVVSIDYDFWYELAKSEDRLEKDERPSLNSDGRLFYVCFRLPPAGEPIWPNSLGHKTLDDAMSFAESKVPSRVEWS